MSKKSSRRSSSQKAQVSKQRIGATRRTSPEEFEEEYTYVYHDLRRIFTVAVIMFTLLIIVNLLLSLA